MKNMMYFYVVAFKGSKLLNKYRTELKKVGFIFFVLLERKKKSDTAECDSSYFLE